MHDDVLALTEREKETLRLLVEGHDAKSMALHLGLSVHTINERLRDARRKLKVSSSREAARLLAAAEQAPPNSLADRFLGVSPDLSAVPYRHPSSRWQHPAQRLVWFGGGMLIMSLVIAAVALSSAFHGSIAADAPSAGPVVAVTDASASAGQEAARAWLGLLDRQDWEASWRSAAAVFKAQITAPQWAAMATSVRQPLGAVSSRNFRSVTKASTLPGAPAGEYEILQFQTNFAHKAGAIETVTLVHDHAVWRVAGYFIR